MISFFIPLKNIPTVTHQMKRVACVGGKPKFYEDDRLLSARSLFTGKLIPHIPDTPYSGVPLRVVVKWLFKITKSSKHNDGDYKITKPDTHNLNKLLFDIMEDLGFWDNDAIVASEIIEKFWAKTPGVYIEIIELPTNGT